MRHLLVKHALWFLLQTAIVYLSVNLCTLWLAGWVARTLIPYFRGTGPAALSAGFQLTFSHLFVLSFVPAAVAGSLNARFRQSSAYWVWILPACLLGLAIARFPHSLLDQSWPGISHYFGDVAVPEFHSYQEMSQRMGPWIQRSLDQKNLTAPFYAGIGYSVAAWASMRWKFYSLGKEAPPVANDTQA